MAVLVVAPTAGFRGFSPELLGFFDGLAANNTRDWFHAHRADYERYFLEPARELVLALGARLRQLNPAIHAEPKVHGSILAITRDTRFSADKTPYKTWLDLWFWHGEGPSRERPGYFARLSAESLILGAGIHVFSAVGALERYREAVLDPGRGAALEAAVAAVGPELIGGRTYKRVPHGLLPADHPRADWLRHSGLYAQVEQPLPDELYTPAFAGACFAELARLTPLLQWLVDLFPG